jgi:hypothetical protein
VIIIAKKKRAKASPKKPVYEYKEREFIIKEGFGWMKYRKFSSKQSAQNGIKTVKKAFGRSVNRMSAVNTTRGWTVFQLGHPDFRTKASEIKKHGKRKY